MASWRDLVAASDESNGTRTGTSPPHPLVPCSQTRPTRVTLRTYASQYTTTTTPTRPLDVWLTDSAGRTAELAYHVSYVVSYHVSYGISRMSYYVTYHMAHHVSYGISHRAGAEPRPRETCAHVGEFARMLVGPSKGFLCGLLLGEGLGAEGLEVSLELVELLLLRLDLLLQRSHLLVALPVKAVPLLLARLSHLGQLLLRASERQHASMHVRRHPCTRSGDMG